MYDTRDFIDDYYVGPEGKNDQQLLFIAKGNVENEISERMTELSREFRTAVKKEWQIGRGC